MKLDERTDIPGQIIYRITQKAYKRKKGLKGKRPVMTPEQRKEARKKSRSKSAPKLKAERKRRILAGVCTACGKNPATEGYRSCDRCRAKANIYDKRRDDKEWVLDTYGFFR